MLRISKRQFILTGLILILGVFMGFKLFYLANAYVTQGTVVDMRYRNTGRGTSKFSTPIVEFKVDTTLYHFRGEENLDCQIDDKLPVLYQKKNPRDARIYTFNGFWVRKWPYCIMPVFLFMAFATSLPRKSYIRIDFKTLKVSIQGQEM